MELKAIIVHQIIKKRGEAAKSHLRKALLPVNDELKEFIASVKTAYYKKSNPVYGIFDPDEGSYPYQNMLKKYLNEEMTFYEFSEKAVEHFIKTITKVYQATGGYILFAHFKDKGDFIKCLLLNNKKQYNIDDETLSLIHI